jgi:hypothetical protein
MSDSSDIFPAYKGRLVNKHLLVIPFDDNVDEIHKTDDDKLVVLQHLEECASSSGFNTTVGFVWERSDGITGYFPGYVTELRDFALKNSYKAIKESCNVTITCPP